MALLEQWQKVAYNEKADRGELQRFWQRYFLLEKGVYEQLLTNPDEKVEGTVKELAEKYNLSVMEMTGFLDGINDSLVEANPIDTMEEDTKVNLVFDKEKLYKNMVDAKADWLYELPQWKEIFDDEKRKTLFLEQKKSGTVHVGKKVGRNDPCPCGSGKKYKYCCGRQSVIPELQKRLYRQKKRVQNDPSQNDEEKSSISKSPREEGVWCERSGLELCEDQL